MPVEAYLRTRRPLPIDPVTALPGPGCTLRVGTFGEADLLAPAGGEPDRGAGADLQSRAPPPDNRVLAVYLCYRTALVSLLGPGTAPCEHCLARRWQHVRATWERDSLERGVTAHAMARTPYLTAYALEAIWQLAAQLVRRAATGPLTDAVGHPYVYELDLTTTQLRRHPLVADSGCPRCAHPAPDSAGAATLTLASRPKRSPDELRLRPAGSYRLNPAAYANPVCGVVGADPGYRLGSTTTAPAVGHLDVRGEGYLHRSFWGGHADSYQESVRRGILEGLERHAGLRPRRTASTVHASYRHLREERGEHVLDPRDCGLYGDEVYASDPTNVKFATDLVLRWVWGYSLRDARPILVPESMVYYHLPQAENRFTRECSNGCALGSCLEEAVLHGLLELIERDAFLLSWYGRRSLPEIDAGSLRTPHTRFMVDRMALCGYDVRFFDTRMEFPIPVVTAVAARRDGGPGTLIFGAGTHLDPEAAAQTALYETALAAPDFAAQITSVADGLRAMVDDFSKVQMLQHHPGLFGLPEMAHHAGFMLGAAGTAAAPLGTVYRDWQRQRPSSMDLLDDLKFCLDQIVGAGFDVIAVDQTSPEQIEIGLRTVRVIVPGLLPIDFGWSRQRALRMPRLREAFRRAGQRDTPLDEADLHLVPHPFP